jgi:tRNA1(Val) A37 N6-methylase TrmN6
MKQPKEVPSPSGRAISEAMSDTTQDYFLGDRLSICQPVRGYRAGIDAVLLAACARDGESPLLDLGAGVGTVGLCAAVRCRELRIVLLERQGELADLARMNVTANHLEGRVSVVEAEIGEALPPDTIHLLQAGTFAHVVANPPFHDVAAGTSSHWPLKAVSHAMTTDALELWSRFMARMTMPGGRATMIHKAEALPGILATFENRFGGITILPIHPRDGAPAIRVIVDGIKGSRAPIVIKPGLILHGAGNAFRPDVDAVLRNGAALAI